MHVPQINSSQILKLLRNFIFLPGRHYRDFFFLNFFHLFGKDSTVLREYFAFLIYARGLQFRYDVLMEKSISANCIAFRIPHQLIEGARNRIFINVLQVL